LLRGIVDIVTTAGNFRSTVARAACDVSVAGVPWPAYKVIALLVGLVAFLVVGVLTMSAAPAVLSGAAAATVSWLGFGFVCAGRR
jgi:hypothetical protein